MVKKRVKTPKPIRASQIRVKKEERGDEDIPEQGQVQLGIDAADLENLTLSADLKTNLAVVKKFIGASDDVIFHEFQIGKEKKLDAAFIFIDGLADKATIDNDLLRPLLLELPLLIDDCWDVGRAGAAERIKSRFLAIREIREDNYFENIIESILDGEGILLFDGCSTALIAGVKGWEHRAVSEPMTEKNVRGPQDAFNEVLRTNTALIRRRVKDHNLVIRSLKIGKRSKTVISLAYIKDVVNPALVKEVEYRLEQIDTDSILESGYIEQYIEDNPYSPFPQIQYTERPDKVAAALLEGRVAIITDGTPNVLIVPTVLSNFWTAAEDYYERWLSANLLRLFRTINILIAIILPSLYIAIVTYHQEMLPTPLAFSVAGARQGIPFPAFVEALVMEVALELLREAGIRLPGVIGQTIGIVGGIILGQAAVSAGVVSPLMIVIVALTAIGSFSVPSYSAGISLRILRFPLMILGAMLGLYGVMFGVIIILIHLVTLSSFGIPYLAPLTPARLNALKDTAIRMPLWAMEKRPTYLRNKDNKRQSSITSYFEKRIGKSAKKKSQKGEEKE